MVKKVTMSFGIAVVVLFFAAHVHAIVQCKNGCNSFWTGRIWLGKCQLFDPYTCFDGASYFADVDEGGPCIAVDPSDPQSTYTAYSCGSGSCSAVCDACNPGDTCLQYGWVNQSCVPILRDQSRKECTGFP